MRSLLLLTFLLTGVLFTAAQTPTLTITLSPEAMGAMAKIMSPKYPPDALSKFRGKERMDVFVELDKSGRAKDVTVFGPWFTCGKDDAVVEALQKAVIEAARSAVFPPGEEDDRPVSAFFLVEGTMPPPPPADPKDRSTGGVVNGHAISKPTPKVSSKAKKFKAQGAVSIEIVIDEEGKPITAKARSGHPLLFKGAAEAACEARYTPTLLAGSPVKVSAVITYNFVP